MTTINCKEEAKRIRKELKKEFPKWKFSVKSDYNSIDAYILRGPIDFKFEGEYQIKHRNKPLSSYSIDKLGISELVKINSIIHKNNWNNSDPMTDYFDDVGFYGTFEIGRWDTPYEFINN